MAILRRLGAESYKCSTYGHEGSGSGSGSGGSGMSNRFSVIGNRRVCEFTSSVVIVRCSPVPFRDEAQIQVQVSKLI